MTTPDQVRRLITQLEAAEEESAAWPGILQARPGATVLDQLHQGMILFGAGRGEALKQFLVEEGQRILIERRDIEPESTYNFEVLSIQNSMDTRTKTSISSEIQTLM